MTIPKDETEWQAAVAQVTQAMQAYTTPFCTPLSRVISEDEGELLGTGAYISALGKRLLVTNDHNLVCIKAPGIAAKLHGCDQYYRVPAAVSFAQPFDVGFGLIADAIWNLPELQPHSAGAAPFSKLAAAHAPVENEILFMKGYAGQGSTFLFGSLLANATAYCMREVPLPAWNGVEKLDERFHFAVDYRPDLAHGITPGAQLPDPHGFSGSLLWNTRYVEALTQGYAWMPDHAQVTGIIWGWPSSAACLVATRVEHLRSSLLQALQEFHSRGDIAVT